MIKGNATHLLVVITIILTACTSAATPKPQKLVKTMVVTEVVIATPAEVVQVVTPTPEPEGPRTLVICQGQEPDTLYPYGGSLLAAAHILEAVSEGSWGGYDSNSYDHQPVILEKLPSLADGDAAITTVTINEGDVVVDANGDVVEISTGSAIMLNPAGGGDPVPYEGGEFEMDQLSATFTMLPNLMWSDGVALTANDSVYAFDLITDPDTQQSKFVSERTAAYDAIDERTVVWTGLPGYKDSSYFLNFFGPAPKHLWGKYSAAELITAEESSLAPIGWGPFVIEEWIQGDSVILRKNPNYYRANEGLPRFDNLIYRFVGQNANSNIAALLSGECDILAQLTGLDDQIELMLEMNAKNQLNATFTTGTVWALLSFGIQHIDYDNGYDQGIDRPDFFSDVRTRKAFAHCLDRQAMVEKITYGQTMVFNSYIPMQHPLYNPDVIHYEFDVSTGIELFEEVGWLDHDGDPATPRIAQGAYGIPDGTELKVTVGEVSVPVIEIMTEMVQDSLSRCGIQVDIKQYPRTEYFAEGPEGDLFGRKFDLGLLAWLTGVQPPCDLYLSTQTPGPIGQSMISIQNNKEIVFESGWGGQNNSGFVNEQYDMACKKALNSLPGTTEYELGHKDAQLIFADQLPVVPIYQQIKLAATRPDMCGFIMDPTANSEFWNIEEFDYGEGCED